MTIKDGGPAFPVSSKNWDGAGKLVDVVQPGMTLRDYFAAKALSGPAVFNDTGYIRTPDETALVAYQMADAMLAAREVQS